MMRKFGFALALWSMANPSSISAQEVTKEQVKLAFANGVVLCAKAVSARVSVSSLPLSEQTALTPAGPNTMGPTGRVKGRPMFEVAPAAGIVALEEATDATCEVVGYGPKVLDTYSSVKAALLQFAPNAVQTQSETTTDDFLLSFDLPQPDGSYVKVQLVGGEPGMGSRRFRLPMFTALIRRDLSATQATTGPQGTAGKRSDTPTMDRINTAVAAGLVFCARTIASGRTLAEVPDAERAGLFRADPATNEIAKSVPNRVIYEVEPARDFILLTEPNPGSCTVVGGGPRIMQIFDTAKAALTTVVPNLTETRARQKGQEFRTEFDLPQSDGTKLTVMIVGREWGQLSPGYPFTHFTAVMFRKPSH